MGLPFWPDKEKGTNVAIQANTVSQENVIVDGDNTYTAAEGINSTSVTYQLANGAPVEKSSPLGYSVTFWTSLCLNINQMIGTGIFSTRMVFLYPDFCLVNMCYVAYILL